MDNGLLAIGAGYQAAQTAVLQLEVQAGVIHRIQDTTEKAVADILQSVNLSPAGGTGQHLNVVA